MSKSLHDRQQDINRKIDENYEALHEARDECGKIREKLDDMQVDRSRYSLLSEISDLLDQLQKQGGAELFWGEDYDRGRAERHTEYVRNRVIEYDSIYSEIQQEYEAIEDRIASLAAKANILNEESATLEEVAEEAKHDFVIERELVKEPFRPMIMPWTGNPRDERRFYRIVASGLALALLLAILIPLWEVPVPDRFVPVEVPERLAKLVVQKKPPPPPPPPKVEEQKPEDLAKKKPTKKPVEATKKQATVARKKAESAGLLAFKNNFSALVDTGPVGKIGAKARISTGGKTAKKASRSILTSQATAAGGSGGISTASLSRDVGGAGSGIKGVAFERVESAIGSDFFGEERPLSDGAGPSRTDEEIQIVFDRYKSALYRIYNRELRNNPTLQGKMVLRLTIQPDGKVSACKVESSDMDSATLNTKIVERVLAFNFGPKEGVPPVTILYPIDFLPAS